MFAVESVKCLGQLLVAGKACRLHCCLRCTHQSPSFDVKNTAKWCTSFAVNCSLASAVTWTVCKIAGPWQAPAYGEQRIATGSEHHTLCWRLVLPGMLTVLCSAVRRSHGRQAYPALPYARNWLSRCIACLHGLNHSHQQAHAQRGSALHHPCH